MGTIGSFGYKFGRKTRLMHVSNDADLLWQILVREIYVLMKHYENIETLREKFVNLKDAKGKPSKETVEKCKIFTELNELNKPIDNWYILLKYCQHSFINILESGFFLNNGNDELGNILLLDFNTNTIKFYNKDDKKKEIIYRQSTINEIMEFEGMPTKTLNEIVTEMRERFNVYQEKIVKIENEQKNIKHILDKAKEIKATEIMNDRAKNLLDDLNWEKTKLDMGYRLFYYRLDALNLIDHTH